MGRTVDSLDFEERYFLDAESDEQEFYELCGNIDKLCEYAGIKPDKKEFENIISYCEVELYNDDKYCIWFNYESEMLMLMEERSEYNKFPKTIDKAPLCFDDINFYINNGYTFGELVYDYLDVWEELICKILKKTSKKK